MRERILLTVILVGFLSGPFFSTAIQAQKSVAVIASKDNTIYHDPVSGKVITATVLNQVRIFPNPFRDQVTIEYHLFQDASVECKVYNILGKEIRPLVDAYQAEGKHRTIWNGTDDSGKPVKQGMYYAIFSTGKEKKVIKIIKSK